ncbi:MAG: hypothetical protein AAF483_17095 [Planctomycetota bacterium]
MNGYGTNAGSMNNAGTFNIDASMTFTNQGTLLNTGTINANGFLVNDGGTIAGAGMINGQLEDAGILQPGNSAGVLVVTGNLLKTGGSLEIELGGTFDGGGDNSQTEFDWIEVGGDVELAGILDVTFINGFDISGFMSFEIIDVGGSLTGEFDGLAEGGLVGQFGATDLFITYAGGDGNDIVLFGTGAVPEPSSVMVLAFTLLLRSRRRRRA